MQAEQERKKRGQKHPQTSEGSVLQKFANPIASMDGGRSVSHFGHPLSCSSTGSPAGVLCSACDGAFLAANMGPQLRNMLSSEHGELQPEPEPEPEPSPAPCLWGCRGLLERPIGWLREYESS